MPHNHLQFKSEKSQAIIAYLREQLGIPRHFKKLSVHFDVHNAFVIVEVTYTPEDKSRG